MKFLVVVVGVCAILALAGCKSGVNMASAEHSTGAISESISNEPVRISGSVYVINDGQFSQLNHPANFLARIVSFFIPNSFAAFQGSVYDVLVQLTSGTVELFRLNSDGSIMASLGTAPIVEDLPNNPGVFIYSFPASLTPDSTLMVSVQASAVPMRAFVSGADIDITPASEVVVDTLLASLAINGASLDNYDTREVAAMTAVVTDRDVDLSGRTFSQSVTAIGNDAAATLDSLITSYAGFVAITRTFGSDQDASGGYNLTEFSSQLADPGGNSTDYWWEWSRYDSQTLLPPYGILLRGSLGGGFSITYQNESLSAGRLYGMGTDFNDYGESHDLQDSEYNGGWGNGPVAWNSEFNYFTVAPAPNGQIVFDTEGGRAVVGFVTPDKQILVIPFDKTVPQVDVPDQEIRGVQVMTKRWNVPQAQGSTFYDADQMISQVSGLYGMVEYLHIHDREVIEIVSAYANGVNFNGVAQNVATDVGLTRVGLAARSGSYPYNGVGWNLDPGRFRSICTSSITCLTSGSFNLAGGHTTEAADNRYAYTVYIDGQIQMWDAYNHVGVGGITQDKELMVLPVTSFYGPGGFNSNPPNVRGYMVFGKESNTLTNANLAGTYNIVGQHSYHTNLGSTGEPEIHYGDRYGTLTFDGNGNITSGEFFNSNAILNITNMISIIGTVVTTSNTREVVTGGAYTLNTTTGAITTDSLIVNTVDSNNTLLKTVTMTGSGFVVKNGDFVTLQLGGPDQGSTTKAERGLMYLGKQF